MLLPLRICTHEQFATAPATIYVHSIFTSDIIVYRLHHQFAPIFVTVRASVCGIITILISHGGCGWAVYKQGEGSKKGMTGKNWLRRGKTDGGSNRRKRSGEIEHTLHYSTVSSGIHTWFPSRLLGPKKKENNQIPKKKSFARIKQRVNWETVVVKNMWAHAKKIPCPCVSSSVPPFLFG